LDRFIPFYPSKYKERKDTRREEWEEGTMAVLADDGEGGDRAIVDEKALSAFIIIVP
jgi:hypothetical protein